MSHISDTPATLFGPDFVHTGFVHFCPSWMNLMCFCNELDTVNLERKQISTEASESPLASGGR